MRCILLTLVALSCLPSLPARASEWIPLFDASDGRKIGWTALSLIGHPNTDEQIRLIPSPDLSHPAQM